MDPKNPEEEQRIFDEQVAKSWEKLEPTHDKKEFTFSTVEKRRLVQQDLIEKFAAQAMQDIVNLTTLPRVGVTPNEKVFTLYDISLGKLTVFIPKPTPEVTPKTESDQPKP